MKKIAKIDIRPGTPKIAVILKVKIFIGINTLVADKTIFIPYIKPKANAIFFKIVPSFFNILSPTKLY